MLRGLTALALGATVVGCTASSVQESSDGRIIAISGQASDAQEEALAKGTAESSEGGCMVIQVGETYLNMFPQGTTIDDNDEVTLPNGFQMSAGDEIVLGGGYHSSNTTQNDLSAIPDDCLTVKRSSGLATTWPSDPQFAKQGVGASPIPAYDV